MSAQRIDREPCPWRVVEDAGGAFVFGLVGGTVWHTVGGARNAPKGQRIAQAISRAKARVPMLGGSFAVWGILFSSCDCTLTYLRKKEDPWNAIYSGAATGGILAARAGLKAAGRSALAGGAVLAAIEGLNIVLTRLLMPYFEKQQMEAGMEIDRLLPPQDPTRPRRVVKQAPLWQQNAAPSPLFTPGFDTNTSSSSPPQWDSSGFKADFGTSAEFNSSSSNDDSENKSSSSWKLW